jgi:hypothetical protein
MLCDFKPMPGSHCVLNRFELSREKLNDPATLGTDHVVVVLVFVIVLVMGPAIAKSHFTSQACFAEQF